MTDTPRTDAFIAGRDPIRLPHPVYDDMEQTIAVGTAIRNLMIEYAEHARALERELTAARAECEQLKANAARYRWVRENCSSFHTNQYPGFHFDITIRLQPDKGTPTLDAAIDAAIDAEPAKERAK